MKPERHCVLCLHRERSHATADGSCVALVDVEMATQHVCGCPCFSLARAVEPDAADTGDGLVLANDAEHALIERLALAIGHRLLLEWDAVPADARVLTLNRAALSTLARVLGVFLASVAIVDPSNDAGWQAIVETALEMVRQTAAQKREEAIAATQPPGGLLGIDPTQPVYVFPAPETVM